MSGIANDEGTGVDAGLPEGWAWASIGDLCEVNPRQYESPPDDDDELSFVPMPAVEAESGRLDASQVRRYGDVKRKSLTKFQEGDVLFAKITPCMENGKTSVASGLRGGRGIGSTEFHVLRVSDGLDPRFLMHFLLQKSVRATAERHMTGAVGQRRVPTSYLASLEVPVPPLTEQRRIVEALEGHLSRLEVGEQQVIRCVKRADQLRKSLSSIAHRNSVPADSPRATAPRSVGTVDGALPDVPDTWRWERLGDIADVVGGVTKDKKKQSDPSIPEVPYLRVANVQRGRLDLSQVSTIRVAPEKAEKLALMSGDVLLNEGGDRDKLGRGWIWEDQIPGSIHQNHVFRARVDPNVLHPKLLSWYANSVGAWFEANGKQSVNLASISLSKIKLLPVPVPPPEIQTSIVERIEGEQTLLDNAYAVSHEALVKCAGLRQALLHQAFTGRLVPQDPTDEPASALLARIREERAAQAGVRPKRARRAAVKRAAPTTSAPTAPPAPAAAAVPLPARAVQETFDVFQDQDQGEPQNQDAAQ